MIETVAICDHCTKQVPVRKPHSGSANAPKGWFTVVITAHTGKDGLRGQGGAETRRGIFCSKKCAKAFI